MIVQSLLLASGGILSVGSITLVILLLISSRGWRNGLGYMLGYTCSYSAIGIAFVVVGYDEARLTAGRPGRFLPLLFIVLGILLLYVTLRNWRKPAADPGGEASPRLFAIVDRATPPKAFAVGMLVSIVNFKNMAIFVSAISVVHLSDLTLVDKVLSALLVTFVFCLSVIVPVLIYLVLPRHANEALTRIKQTLEQHSRAIGIWVPFIFAVVFLLRGIGGLR